MGAQDRLDALQAVRGLPRRNVSVLTYVQLQLAANRFVIMSLHKSNRGIFQVTVVSG